MNKEVQKALKAKQSFSARGSKCPICKANFRSGCSHSVTQAMERLEQNYIKAVARSV